MHVDDVISLALAGFFVYAGIRILRSPEHHASIRFQPWTYRRVKHKPSERDVRNAQAVGALMFALAAAAVVLFVLRVRHA